MLRLIRILVAVSLAIALLVVAWTAHQHATRLPFLLGGIQVNEPDNDRWLEAVQDAGMNTVAITVYARQGDWDSDHLWSEQDEVGVVTEIRDAKKRGLHVVLIPRVALDHAFRGNRFLWHGMILPGDDRLLDSWFAKYTHFIVRWAKVAEAEGIEVFGVGSEMNILASTVPIDERPGLEDYYLDDEKQTERKAELLAHREQIPPRQLFASGGMGFETLESYLDAQSLDHQEWAGRVACVGERDALECMNRRRRKLDAGWRELIGEVREVYRGRITYAANFDQYQEVGFWDDLDFIGINAYFPLRDPSFSIDRADLYESLEAGWSEVFCELTQFRRRYGLGQKPFLFTEIGYTYRKNTTLAPWAGSGFSLLYTEAGHRLMVWDDQPEDFEERALAIRALDSAAAEVERELERGEAGLLAGLLYWKLSTDPSHLAIEPFVHILGSDTEDPLSREWIRFTDSPSILGWLGFGSASP